METFLLNVLGWSGVGVLAIGLLITRDPAKDETPEMVGDTPFGKGQKQDWVFLLGGTILLVYAILGGFMMWIGLQSVVEVGVILPFFPKLRTSHKLSILLPISVGVIVLLFVGGEIRTSLDWIIISGLVLFAFGFSFIDPRLLLPGGLCILVACGFPFLGILVETPAKISWQDPRLMFAVLNVLFSLSALHQIRMRRRQSQ